MRHRSSSPSSLRLVSLVGVVALFVACSQTQSSITKANDNKPAEGGNGGTQGASTAGSPSSGAAGTTGPDKPVVDCAKARPGAKMVRIERPEQGDAYCIDATETTQAEYEVFRQEVGAAPSKWDSDAYCKTSNRNGYNPQVAPPTDVGPQPCAEPSFWDPAGHPQRPATCVDWCDASAYCAWAGKRLCGMRDGAKVAFDPETLTGAVESSEWGVACAEGASADAEKQPRPKACIPEEQPGGGVALLDVGAEPLCTGTKPPFDAIQNLQGGVDEWQADCVASRANPAVSVCFVRGLLSTKANVERSVGACTTLGRAGQVDAQAELGFRCCGD